MNIAELTGIGGAVIGDMELYGIQLKDEVEMAENKIAELTEEIEWLRANEKAGDKARDLWRADAMASKKKLEGFGATETLVRNMLDEIELADDTEHTSALRKIYWNDSDTEKELKAEYAECDEESNTAAWHEMNVGE